MALIRAARAAGGLRAGQRRSRDSSVPMGVVMRHPMPMEVMDDTARRLLPVVSVAPYALLAVVGAVTSLPPPDDAARANLGLCLLAAWWVRWLYTLHPSWRLGRVPWAIFF